MKNQLTYLAVFILSVFFIQKIQAAHIIGGVMTYKCLGNNEYEVTLKIYRDCQGGGASFDGPLNGSVTLYSSLDSQDYELITLPNPTVTEIVPVAPDGCLGIPSGICVEEGVYVFNMTLPLMNDSYYLVYQRCCRNASITNIIGPQETGATYFIEITADAQALCNNSPTFDVFPPIVICVNEPLNVDHSATDVEGDSLVYEFCSPLRGGGTDGFLTPGDALGYNGTNPTPDAPPPFAPVTYISPQYSPTNPLGGNAISIDPVTGFITGTPQTIGQFEVGVCVKDYRDGVLLSKIQRDFQFNVKSCPPILEVDFDIVENDSLVYTFPNNSLYATYYEWDFGDGNTSTEESPTHTYSQSGSYTVKLIGYDTDCNTSMEVTKQIDMTTSNIELVKNNTSVEIFPNPSQGDFFLKIKNSKVEDFQVELFDLNGKVVNSFLLKDKVGETIEPIKLSHLSKGIYFLKLTSETSVLVERVFIQ